VARILVHVTHGREPGHDVPRGRRRAALRDSVLDNLSGLGTARYASRTRPWSRRAAGSTSQPCQGRPRGLTEADLEGKPAELAMPNVLVQLALEHDRAFTY
jgi:hypothetical protein